MKLFNIHKKIKNIYLIKKLKKCNYYTFRDIIAELSKDYTLFGLQCKTLILINKIIKKFIKTHNKIEFKIIRKWKKYNNKYVYEWIIGTMI